MLRIGELILALAPFAAGAILYFLIASGRNVPRLWLLLATLAVFGMGGWLTWLGTSDRLDREQHYVPAVLRNGEVVQGHGS